MAISSLTATPSYIVDILAIAPPRQDLLRYAQKDPVDPKTASDVTPLHRAKTYDELVKEWRASGVRGPDGWIKPRDPQLAWRALRKAHELENRAPDFARWVVNIKPSSMRAERGLVDPADLTELVVGAGIPAESRVTHLRGGIARWEANRTKIGTNPIRLQSDARIALDLALQMRPQSGVRRVNYAEAFAPGTSLRERLVEFGGIPEKAVDLLIVHAQGEPTVPREAPAAPAVRTEQPRRAPSAAKPTPRGVRDQVAIPIPGASLATAHDAIRLFGHNVPIEDAQIFPMQRRLIEVLQPVFPLKRPGDARTLISVLKRGGPEGQAILNAIAGAIGDPTAQVTRARIEEFMRRCHLDRSWASAFSRIHYATKGGTTLTSFAAGKTARPAPGIAPNTRFAELRVYMQSGPMPTDVQIERDILRKTRQVLNEFGPTNTSEAIQRIIDGTRGQEALQALADAAGAAPAEHAAATWEVSRGRVLHVLARLNAVRTFEGVAAKAASMSAHVTESATEAGLSAVPPKPPRVPRTRAPKLRP